MPQPQKQEVTPVRSKLSIFALCIFFLTTGCGQKKPPVEVSIEEIQGVPILHIQSITDSVNITELKINRGNCRGSLSAFHSIPEELAFGAEMKIFAHNCNVKELSLDTDHGSFSFSF